MWLESYEEKEELGYTSNDFQKEIDEIWDGLKPLYEKLHAFVRHRLYQNYPGYQLRNSKIGSIPSNIFQG